MIEESTIARAQISESVLIQKVTKPHECSLGLIADVDKEKGVIVRRDGDNGGEFVAQLELLETGVAENKRRTWRFFKIPMTEQAKQIFRKVMLERGNGIEEKKDSDLDEMDTSKLGVNSVLRISSVGFNGMVVDEFSTRIVEEMRIKGKRIFVLEDEFGNSYDVPEVDVRRGRHDRWMRFDGIVPKKENGGVDNS